MSTILEQDFLSQLHIIQSHNPPSLVLFPETKGVYDIDLKAREIHGPKVLSVAHDHKAETVYFRVDRYHEYMDLSRTVCVVQYITPDGSMHVYPVPFFDVTTERHKQKMLFPWCIDGMATRDKGIVTYSIRFYKIEEKDEEYSMIFNLSTTPTTGEVLHGMQVTELSTDFDIPVEQYDILLQKIHALETQGTYWDTDL